MSTRGAFGFIKNKEYKVHYNHFDSYLEGKGENVVDYVRNTSIEDMNKAFDSIVLVNQTDLPKPKEEKEILEFLISHELINLHDPEHFGSGQKDWYYYLSPTQGNLKLYNEGLKYMTDDKDFLNDGLFCEFAYLVDLDENKLRIMANDKECSYDFDKIPDDWIDRTYLKLENRCKDKFMNLLFDKQEKDQLSVLEDLKLTDYLDKNIKLKPYDYYSQEDAYNSILDNIDELELEERIDNYINKENEIEAI